MTSKGGKTNETGNPAATQVKEQKQSPQHVITEFCRGLQQAQSDCIAGCSKREPDGASNVQPGTNFQRTYGLN